MALPQNHLVLIDGMSFLFRAFHAVRGNLSKTDGTPTNALYGFSQMLIKVVDDLAPTHCVVCLDSPGKTFRHGIYPDYKANRPPPPPELLAQMPYLEPLISAFGLPILRQSGVEADDLIATAIATHGGHVPGDDDTPDNATKTASPAPTRITVVTSDKDLMQLVGTTATTEVKLLDTLKEKFMGLPEVKEKFGVTPNQVVDVQALMGDSSDNVPGVPGIGPKTAADLINTFGNLEKLYARVDEVKNERIRNLLKEHKDKAELSYQLVLLKTDVPLPPDHSLEFHPALHQAADYLRDELEFRTLAKRLETRLQNPNAGPHHAEPLETRSHQGEADHTANHTATRKPNTQHPTPSTAPWGPYECIQTEAAWQNWLQKVRANGWAAFDTETTSLNPLQATLVGISLATAPGQACYVPLGHGSAPSEDLFAEPTERPQQLPTQQVLKDLLALIAEGIPLVAHNLKYDWEVLAHTLSITPGETGPALQTLFTRYEDTMLLSACLDGGRWNHGLDDLTRRHLGHEMIPYEALAGKGKTQITFDAVPLDQATAYAAEDADATARLFLFFVARMKAESLTSATPASHPGRAAEQREDGTDRPATNTQHGPAFVYAEIEKKLLPVIIALESRGITLDTTMLHDLSADLHTRLTALEAQVHELAGESFNLNSPSQLGTILFDKLNLGTDAQKKKKSTGVDVLETLAEDDKNPLARQLGEAMMSYRQLAKLRSTYTEVLPKQVNPVTRRVHTTYHQVGAATGRFSSADPNLQNIPIRTEEGRKIRRAFIPAAPYRSTATLSPGRAGTWSMLSADYSQIELRLLAHFSGSQTLRQAFEEGLDIHAYTAALIGNKPIADVTKTERRAAKIINFGLVYGMGTRSLAKQIGCSQPEAQSWIDAYFQRYNGVKEYMELNKQHARENGYVETLFGRRIWLPDITSPHGGLRANAERAAINAPLQGSNADIIKLAMPKVEAFLAEKNLQAQTLLQVHDELVLEAPDSELDLLKTELPRLMSSVAQLAVPLVVETGTGPNWDAAH